MRNRQPGAEPCPAQHVKALYRRYHRRAYGLASSILCDEEDALDAVQEAFVKVVRHADRVKSLEHPYPWLCRIVTNVCLDRIRRRRLVLVTGKDPTLRQRQQPASSIEFEPSRAFDVQQLQDAIAAGIDRLSEQHRSVIVMRELEGMSYDEIARLCGCPRGTIMSRLFYARRRLRQILGAHVEQEAVAA
jgi:RNA polymerase sigma-70 factor (ECF subfamily)